MDGDLIQGTLQALLQNRQQLAQQQQQAQQQHLQAMQTPMPQLSPIQSMVSDYLAKYASSPGMAWSAMASAAAGAPERERKIDENFLLRQQAAAEQEAKYAGDALKEADTFSSRLNSSLRAGKGSSATVKMDKDGNMVVYDPSSGESRVVHSSQRGEYQRIWAKAYEKAVQEDLENPEGYAANVASKVLSSSPGFNPQKEAIPAQSPAPSSKDAIRLPPGTSPDEEAKALADFRAALSSREQGKGDQSMEALKARYPMTNLPPETSPSAPATMSYKDVRTKEQQKGYGKEEGSELFKERKSLDQLYGTNSKLLGQLSLLEGIYNNPDIPEGELAGQIAALRSGLKSLGVEVSDKAGLTDLAKAVSTGMSLTQRTADGQNLLPGAMSNYEDQLLQKMAPTLTLTSQGRLALIQMMRQVAQSNLRYAEEGTKMASANKDMLPAEWYKRKERIMLEEMAKMKHMSDQLIKQYGGK